jgi:phage pi2 protein 07
MKLLILTSIILSTVFIGCISYYSISTDELIKQLKRQTKTESSNTFQIFTPAAAISVTTKYLANRVEKILCRNSDGELVYVYPNKNTELEFTSKSTHDIITMYFDTVFLEGTKIVGLRSRIITRMTREIEISDIEQIEIYTEMSKTKSYQEK